VNFGLSLTSPRIGISIVRSRIARSGVLAVPGNPDTLSISTTYDKITSTYKSPLILDLGVSLKLLNTQFSGRVAYHSMVNAYAMVDSTEYVTEGSGRDYGFLGTPGMAPKCFKYWISRSTGH